MIRKTFSLILAALMSFVIGATQVQAEAPVAELSIGSYKTISANFKTFGELIDNSQISTLPLLVEEQLNDNIKSFDKEKPSGAFIYVNEKDGNFEGASFLAFIPVANQDELFKPFEENEALELDKAFEFKGVKMTKVTFNEATGYFITKDGWTFFSDQASKLLVLPKNPAEALGDMPSKYLLAVKLNVDSVSDSAKKWVLDQINNGVLAAQQANDDDDDDDDDEDDDDAEELAELSKIQQEAQLKAIKAILYEVKNLTIGVAFDDPSKTLRFDFDVNPIENTELAKTFKAFENVAGFGKVALKDATIYQTQTELLREADANDTLKTLGLIKSLVLKGADECDAIKDSKKFNALIEKTSKVVENIVKANAGKIVQKGGALFFKEDDISFVAASEGAVVEGVDALIKEWIKAIDDNVDKYFKADVETWKGLTFNVATIPTDKIVKELNKAIDDDDEEEAEQIKELVQTIQAIYGEKIEIAYAVGEKEFYFAAGKDAVGLIKKTFENDAVVPEGQQDYLNIKVGEFLTTLSKFTFISEDIRDAIEAIAVEAGEDSAVVICAQANKTGGATYRLQLNGGAIKAFNATMMIVLPKILEGGDYDDDDDDDYDD